MKLSLPVLSISSTSALAQQHGAVRPPFLGAVKKIAGMLQKQGGVVPLDNRLVALEKQLVHQKTLTRMVKSTFQSKSKYTQKQEIRQRVATLALDIVPKVAGYKVSMQEFVHLIKASAGHELSTAENKYIEKLYAKVIQSKNGQFSDLYNDYAWLKADVRAVFEGFLAEYPPEQQIGHLSIERVINSQHFHQDLLEALNGTRVFQLLDTPKNQKLAQRLNNKLLGRVAEFKEKYGEEALQKFVRQEVSALSTLGSAQFPLALKHLVVKGPEWVRSDFLSQRDALMHQVRDVLSGLPERFQQAPYLPVSTLTPAGLSSWLKEQLNLGNTEPWSQMPDYVNHLLAQPCQEALRTTPMTALIDHYLQLKQNKHVVALHAENFGSSHPLWPMTDARKQKQINDVYQQVFEQTQDIEEGLFKHLIGAAIETKPYQLETEKNTDGPALVKVSGGYFKAHKKAYDPALPATRVRTASGKVYELLNTLSPEASQALHKQQGLNRRGKVVLGSGTYGKVRLARDLDTKEIVVVKKFVQRSRELANDELDKFKLVQDRTVLKGEAVSNTLASELDHAHVKVPSRVLSNKLVDKSYIFMPLINGGDGNQAIGSLSQMRQLDRVNHTNHAHSRFLHIAKGYAESVKNLHEMGLYHRDIKPDNFMHSWVKGAEQGKPIEQLKLIDFGFLEDAKTKTVYQNSTAIYLPPETHTPKGRKSNYDAEKHDSYSLGMSLFDLWTGCPLYDKNYSTNFVPLKLKRADGSLLQVKLEVDSRDFVGSYTNQECCKGVASAHLKDLPLNHVDNIIAKLLAADPKERISAKQALEAFQQLDVRPVEKSKPLNDGAGPSGQKRVRFADELGKKTSN